MEPRFIVDANVGKLARWLRLVGYDALFAYDIDDRGLVDIAMAQNRVLLTKDTQILMRKVALDGRLKAILIKYDDSKAQLRQVVDTLNLDYEFSPFSRCLECNEPLVSRTRDEVRDLVPPYVFETLTQYMQCPSCHRIYWRGTHWQRMKSELERLGEGVTG